MTSINEYDETKSAIDLDVGGIIKRLKIAASLIETGEPWYSPQPYAVAAIEDCQDAIEALRKEGLTSSALELAMLAVSNASECTRTHDEHEMLAAYAKEIRQVRQKQAVQP